MKLNDDGNDDKDRRNMAGTDGTVLRVPQASRAMAVSRTKFATSHFLECIDGTGGGSAFRHEFLLVMRKDLDIQIAETLAITITIAFVFELLKSCEYYVTDK